jgi:hypothetical protein
VGTAVRLGGRVRAQRVVEGASRGVRHTDRWSRARLGVRVQRYDSVRRARARDAVARVTSCVLA